VSKGLANITLIRHDGTPAEAESGRPYGGDARALLIIKQLISQGLTEHATDIHFDPKPTEVSVRLRMDGILHAYPSLKLDLGPKVMTAVKVLAAMDIAKKNVAQDGSFSAQVYTKHIDLRVASQPGIHGEIMTVRILNRDTDLIRLERLGMRPDQQARIKALIQSPNGVCLVSGPTGAGKTTTLYAAIQDIDARQRHILTIENPVEYRLPNVNQTSINPKAGVTFATALRASLRQDPNIIMVGEIRDAETARTAMSAAMTGHLVLTTVHATDSITALFRLFDLTIEPYLIASAMKMIIAQRLVRLLCAKCRVSTQLRPDQLRKLGIVSGPGVSIFKAKGCSDCHGTGYSGRTGIFEILDISSKIREMIAAKATRDTIKQEARRGGFISLMEDGIRKVAAGMTSLEELSRVVR
jgi:type II secretory ATPase GspE/PulE/Tfp pilus assembly ATPase PilB-like protein